MKKKQKVYRCLILCPLSDSACIKEICPYFKTSRPMKESERGWYLTTEHRDSVPGEFCSLQDNKKVGYIVIWSSDNPKDIETHLKEKKLVVIG